MFRPLAALCCVALAFCAFADPAQDAAKKLSDATKKAEDAMKQLDPAKAAQPGPGSEAEKAWMDAATPGEMHAWLAKNAGTWNCTVKTMMPEQPPTVSKGTMTIEMVLDGRYQNMSFSGDFMGMPFHGRGTLGYNNVTGKFESTWMDSMSTGTMFISGTLDKATKTMTLIGEFDDPVTKAKMTQREVTVYSGDDQMNSEFFHKDAAGKEYKVMEIAYTRAPVTAPSPAKPAAMKPATKPTGAAPTKPEPAKK